MCLRVCYFCLNCILRDPQLKYVCLLKMTYGFLFFFLTYGFFKRVTSTSSPCSTSYADFWQDPLVYFSSFVIYSSPVFVPSVKFFIFNVSTQSDFIFLIFSLILVQILIHIITWGSSIIKILLSLVILFSLFFLFRCDCILRVPSQFGL